MKHFEIIMIWICCFIKIFDIRCKEAWLSIKNSYTNTRIFFSVSTLGSGSSSRKASPQQRATDRWRRNILFLDRTVIKIDRPKKAERNHCFLTALNFGRNDDKWIKPLTYDMVRLCLEETCYFSHFAFNRYNKS